MKENEYFVEKNLSESETHDKSSALEEDFTESYKTKKKEFHEVEIKTVNANPKQKEGNKSEFKINLLKCNKCEYSCKKDVRMNKHINTKYDNNTCTKCHLRFDKIIRL